MPPRPPLLLSIALVLGAFPARADLLTDLAAALPGHYDNAAQVEAGGDHPRLNATIAPVTVPGMAGPAFYLQQIQDDFAPHVFRQALLVLEPAAGAVRMRLYRFTDPGAVLDAQDDPGRLAGITPDRLVEDPGCALLWRATADGFAGETAAGACTVESRRLAVRLDRMERWTLEGRTLTQFDRVRHPAGRTLHESPAGQPFRLDRRAPG